LIQAVAGCLPRVDVISVIAVPILLMQRETCILNHVNFAFINIVSESAVAIAIAVPYMHVISIVIVPGCLVHATVSIRLQLDLIVIHIPPGVCISATFPQVNIVAVSVIAVLSVQE